MKTLSELRHIPLKLSSTDLYFSRVKDLPNKNLDMDVWLPSRGMNLQRGNVWTDQQKSELILSVFMERYIPPVRVMSMIQGNVVTQDDLVQVIDGKQRLTTFMEFLRDEFFVIMPADLQGGKDEAFSYSTLPQDYQHAIAWYDIKCQMAYEQFERRFTDDDKVDWFHRINFCGTPQETSHMELLNVKLAV